MKRKKIDNINKDFVEFEEEEEEETGIYLNNEDGNNTSLNLEKEFIESTKLKILELKDLNNDKEK